MTVIHYVIMRARRRRERKVGGGERAERGIRKRVIANSHEKYWLDLLPSN